MQKALFQIGLKKFLLLRKLKNTVARLYAIGDCKSEEIVGKFEEKDLQKTYEKDFRYEKVIKRKDNGLYVNWKGYNSCLNSRVDKKRQYKWVDIFQNRDLYKEVSKLS